MSADELLRLDATAQAELVKKRTVSALELVEAAIARLERENPALNVLVQRDYERARARASAIDSARSDARFAGVPTLLKDIGAEEAGQPITMGMRALRERPLLPAHDSVFLTRLLAAGLVPLGRTNMPELAILATTEPEAYGPTRNPWNREHSAGGSSGGAAAAVAAGIVACAHASDGGGSIRGPANMCSLVGLKPTRARISFGPGRGERWSGMSAEFMLTRSVRDCAGLLDALAGNVPGDPYVAPPPAESYAALCTAPPPRLRVAMLANAPPGMEIDPECSTAVRATAEALEKLGHWVEETHPALLDTGEAAPTWVRLVAASVARALDATGAHLGRTLVREDVEPQTFALAEFGRSLSAPELVNAVDTMHAYGRTMSAFFADFDLLLTPTQAAPPPSLGYLSSTAEEPFRAMFRSSPYGVFTLPFNMTGQPALALPAVLTKAGLPVGVQLVAGYGREDRLLQVAAQLEAARPFPSLLG